MERGVLGLVSYMAMAQDSLELLMKRYWGNLLEVGLENTTKSISIETEFLGKYCSTWKKCVKNPRN